ncbi:MAG: glucose/mannose transport system substrate-binding protein [Pontimonas sp.]|jgi:glucose/mannose transport system substrate-binding protein
MQILQKRAVKTFAASAALTLGLVGCASTAEEEAPATDDAAPAASETLSGSVEVFSWWTGGGEEAGLNALIEIFNAEYPDVEFINGAVAGGAGTNARAVLATRLEASDPPDSFQGHAGAELMDYITAGQLEDLSFLYDEQGWVSVMPDTLLPLITVDGAIYSVPVNIHRSNVMWANPSVLANNNIEMPATWDDFFVAAETLEAAGIIPLALGEQWTQLHLFETVLLGELGTSAYNGLWDGSTDWAGSDVTAAVETFARVLEYTNSDAASLAWQDASQLVINGDAAFNIMGDWAEGFFRVDNALVEQEGYTWAASPGTEGTFQFLSDSFTLPADSANRDQAIAWLTVAGSAVGQDAFNVQKGSIPARSDADRAIYPPYLQSAMDDWASNDVAGSLTHGVTASNAWKADIDTAMGLFLGTKDVAAFQAAMVTAAG